MKESTAKQLLKKVEKDYASIFDEFSDTRNHLWPEFSFFKKYLKSGQKIIDLGCGNGRLYELVKGLQGVDYVGIDNNKKFVQIAQKKYTRANFVVGNLLDIPSGSQADIIFAIASFHHLPSKSLRIKSIQEMKKHLKDDGIIILTNWNLFQKRYRRFIFKSLYNFIVRLGKYDWNDTFIPWSKSGVKRYYHAFTPRELKNLFIKNGFQIEEMFYTRKGEKTSFRSSHNICLVCKKI